MHFTERRFSINGKHRLERGRRKRRARLEPRGVAIFKGARIPGSKGAGELLERCALVARPIELGDGPEGHVALHVERLFCAEAVERYVFLHDLRRIAAAADFLRLRLLRCRLRSSGTLFRGFLFSGRLSRFFRQRISGMRHARHCGLQRRAFARRRNNVSAVLRTDRVFANRDDAARIEFDQKRKAALNAFFSEHPHPDAVLRGILCDAQALNFLGPGNALPLIGRRRRHPNKQGRNRQVDVVDFEHCVERLAWSAFHRECPERYGRRRCGGRGKGERKKKGGRLACEHD